LYGWLENATHYFAPDRRQDDILELISDQVLTAYDHKPVDRAEYANSLSAETSFTIHLRERDDATRRGATGRIGFGVELIRAYVAVVLERLERDGRSIQI